RAHLHGGDPRAVRGGVGRRPFLGLGTAPVPVGGDQSSQRPRPPANRLAVRRRRRLVSPRWTQRLVHGEPRARSRRRSRRTGGRPLPADQADTENELDWLTRCFGSLWVADNPDNLVLRIDPPTGRVQARIHAQYPYAIACGDGGL